MKTWTLLTLLVTLAGLSVRCGDDSSGSGDAGSDAGADLDAGASSPCIVFVDGSVGSADGHDGRTWALAFAAVQDGIDVAAAAVSSGDFESCEVWVAAGTYLPTTDTGGEPEPADPRSRTIVLRAGVALYGGFCGVEASRDERDIDAHETILSGDLGATGDKADNAYHVVSGATGAIIDGFTITGGNANMDSIEGDDPRWYGGGMYNAETQPAVANCTFSDNEAGTGGGMYNISNEVTPSQTTVTRCRFVGNRAVGGVIGAGAGGAMFSTGAASPIVTDCAFFGNSAKNGGAVFGGSEPVFTRCTFSDNAAWDGAGINVTGAPVVSGCVFVDNVAQYFGGGISIHGASDATIVGCTFAGNVAGASGEGGGGGLYNVAALVFLEDSVFASNSAPSGGGMYTDDDWFPLSPVLRNCTFYGNSADYGGAMFNYITTPTAANCIFWGDIAMVSGDEIYSLEAEISLTYSDVEGGCAVDAGCTDDTTGDIDEDPLFVNTDTDLGEIDLHLRAGSPCIDTGSNGALPADWHDLDGDGDTDEPLPWDLDGNPRVAGSSVDMGAYEFQP